jgi:Protein of unknown function (DUF3179)
MLMAPLRHPDSSALHFALWLTVAMLLLCRTDNSPAGQELRIDPREIVTVLPKDSIPAIRDPAPLLVQAAAVRAVNDSDQVLGVTIGGESRAYPIAFLSWHEIVNDIVGGVPIAATWCPLCYTGIVYARAINGRTFTFGVSGKLWANGLIMYDHETDSLWSHVAGQAIAGPTQGLLLRMIPAIHTHWNAWKQLHPKTLVLDPSRSPYRRDYNVDPYESYYSSRDTGIIATRHEDQRLNPKAFVIGLRLDGVVKAYPFTSLGKEPVVNDIVANMSVVVTFQERTVTGRVFNRRVRDRVLTFVSATTGAGEPLTMRDEQTGSLWSGLAGVALEGTLKGERLTPVPATYAFWFAWKDYYPETTVHGEERSGR